jgi:SAM-dependent methyltransferase
MSRDHRKEYHLAWSRLTPPMRPHPEGVAAMRAQIGERPGRTLLLGVTPELADISADLVAIDRNHSMVEHIWPGNTASRRAIVGDWRNATFTPASFSCCVGDTCLGALRFPDETVSACHQVSRLLRPGGKLVCRVFVSPDVHESVEAVRSAALSGSIHNFHAFKIRLGMALITDPSQPRIAVNAIFDAFSGMFKDRDALIRATGWVRDQVDTIDFYRGSSVAFHFPTRDRLLAVVAQVFPQPHFAPSGTNELADRSPLLVAQKRPE